MIRNLPFILLCSLSLFSRSAAAQDSIETTALKGWSSEFRRDIIKVAANVYTAIGYGSSNISMIVGNDGVILIDTGDSAVHAALVLAEFRKISRLPVRAIIYTHSHRDHITGSAVFLNPGAPMPEVWANSRFGSEAAAMQAAGLIINRVRSARQFGNDLPREMRINNGVGGISEPTGHVPTEEAAPLVPTRLVEDRTTARIAGIAIELTPDIGETDDQLSIWLPESKVLFAGDNFYRTMPNLYAIRGTPYRDIRQWANSVDQLLTKQAHVLVGGHTRPVLGEEQVQRVLTRYRDLIRFIFTKTIEGMNRGLTPDQLVEYVQIPEDLAKDKYLQPFYGDARWAVRSIFAGYMGWFDGNATTLFPLGRRAEAERLVTLLGGRSRLLDAAQEALATGDYQWAAQLSDHLLAIDPAASDAKRLKADALEALADHTLNAPARNYYLSAAQELRSERGASKP